MRVLLVNGSPHEHGCTNRALEGEGLAGFVYTQLSDVEEETNGLLTYDRRVNKLAAAPSPT